jgi:hypothetical protein
MEDALEWVLFLALASSGICMLLLAAMLIFDMYRKYLK